MTSNRQKAIAPLRDSLLDMDFEQRFIETLQSSFPSTLVRENASLTVARSDEEFRRQLEPIVPTRVFVIDLHYPFTLNFEVAYVHAFARLGDFPRAPPTREEHRKLSAEARKAAQPVYAHIGSYYSSHVTHSPQQRLDEAPGQATYEREALAWTEDEAASARAAFAAAANEIARMIRLDGEGDLAASASTEKIRAYLASRFAPNAWVKAQPIRRTGERSLILAPGQNFHWIDNRQIKQ